MSEHVALTNNPNNGQKLPMLYWKHAIWKIFSGAALVLLGTLPTIVLGWDTMLISGRIVACTGAAVSVLKALDMLFDQTISRLAAGKTPAAIPGQNGVNGGDTTHISKPVV